MELIYKIALYTHIVAGSLALISGTLAMTTKKGHKLHKLSGKVFYWSMWGTIVLALYISIIKDLRFLLHVGIFSAFQNYQGMRAIKNKSLKPNLIDWFSTLVLIINAGFMISSMSVILMVFGGISVLLLFLQFKTYVQILQGKTLKNLTWLRQHIGMMIGAYIATITAFLVVNMNGFGNAIVLWLAPTFLLVPLMIYWQRKYSK